MNLTHNTTDSQIESALKSELSAAAGVTGAKKSELVTICKALRNELKKDQSLLELAAENARQDKLQTERNNPIYVLAITQLRDGFQSHITAKRNKLVEFQNKVADCEPEQIVWNMENSIKETFFASAVVGRLTSIVNHLNANVVDQKFLVSEIAADLDQCLETLQRDLLGREYNHNSTCEVDSVKSRENFRAIQYCFSLFQDAVKCFAADLACDDPADVRHGSRIHSRCW